MGASPVGELLLRHAASGGIDTAATKTQVLCSSPNEACSSLHKPLLKQNEDLWAAVQHICELAEECLTRVIARRAAP